MSRSRTMVSASLGDAQQAEPRGQFALVHDALGREVGILREMDEKRVEVAGVDHGPAQDQRVADRARPLGEGYGAGLLEQADLGEVRPAQSLGDRRAGQDADGPRVAGAPQQEIDHGRIVHRWVRVGQRQDRGDAAGRRRRGGGGDRLAVLGARLADEGVQVDQPRRHHVAAAFDRARAGRQARGVDLGTHRADDALPSTSTPPRVSVPAAGSTRRASMRARAWFRDVRHGGVIPGSGAGDTTTLLRVASPARGFPRSYTAGDGRSAGQRLTLRRRVSTMPAKSWDGR